MSKQSSIEQKVFKSSLDLLLYYLPSAIRGQFKEQIEQAKVIHKEEIVESYREGRSDQQSKETFYHRNSEQYYNETFGGEQC